MKRIFAAVTLLLAALMLLPSCGKTAPVNMDISELGEELIAKVSFDDELVLLNNLSAMATWGVQNAEIVAYAGSGATSEEIVLIDAEKEEDAEAALTLLTTYRDTRRTLFAGYNASQVPRLDSAVLMKVDHYVIYCVSADNSAAQKVIDAFIESHQ